MYYIIKYAIEFYPLTRPIPNRYTHRTIINCRIFNTYMNAQLTTQSATPQVFQDSLAIRARQLRFRGVGNPFTFLDSVGILPVKEFLYKGNNIIDLAEALNLPLFIIHRWIERNNFQQDIDEASEISAEGYIRKGEQALEIAQNKFDLDKAKAMLEHGRFMASKKNKKVYGNNSETGTAHAGVTYNITINGAAPQQKVLQAGDTLPIEAEFEEVKQVALDMNDMFNLGPPPAHAQSIQTGVTSNERRTSEADAEREQRGTSQDSAGEADRWY